MAEFHYCWRCKVEVPLLNEDEWEEIGPLLKAGVIEIRNYRLRMNASLIEALERNQDLPVLIRHRELTGVDAVSFNSLWHHRRSDWGPVCPECNRLFRTPRAKLCAACGYQVAQKD
ncbi:MAG: hypothetical protein ACFCBU_10045 [Cyanophyceae cyanobacterium]